MAFSIQHFHGRLIFFAIELVKEKKGQKVEVGKREKHFLI